MAREKKTIDKKNNHVWEWIVVVAVTILWCALQTLSIMNSDASVLAGSEYIRNAFIENGNALSMDGSFIDLGYLYILKGVFYIVGNHAQAALWVQFALQLAGAWFLYRALRKLVGAIVSVIVYCAVLFAPHFLFPSGEVQPMWMVFFAATLIIYLLVTLFDTIRKKNTTQQDVTAKEKNMKQTKETVKTEIVQAEDKNVTEENKPKVKLLDNPLPGPKKHVSKVMDYDLNLERMPRVFQRYDIKVAEDDDFDIK